MNPHTIRRLTATFIVRMWAEPTAGEAGDWRGQVEHVQTGEKRYFREMDKVLDFIAGHLGGEEEEQTAT
jgi:hypothetical protein